MVSIRLRLLGRGAKAFLADLGHPGATFAPLLSVNGKNDTQVLISDLTY